jgi:ribonuclease BN (tRNA processing enzyme)
MEKDTIIFFDKLGFGWVIDNMTVKQMKLTHFKEDYSVDKSLIKILENIFDYPFG